MKLMPFVKSAVCSALLAGAAVGSHAAVQELGVLTPGVVKNFNGGVIGNSVLFGEILSFSLAAPTPSTTYGVIDVPLPFFGLGSSFSFAALYSNPGGPTSGFDTDEILLAKVFSDGNNEVHFSYSPTAAGNYFLLISGVTTGSSGGAYSGSILVSAAPIPEPESYAMFLVGLGVMGAIVLRRKKSR